MGICGGNAQPDICGRCPGVGIPEDECDCYGNKEDCAGTCGGSLVDDICGVCNGPDVVAPYCDC